LQIRNGVERIADGVRSQVELKTTVEVEGVVEVEVGIKREVVVV
jgi:hypothetical protein